uniref:TBC1 domain family, member 32 n=1 Tax=Cynoglossus semilaevis TaxID=244447 RepID=A0A3P8UNG1_CYNSE
MSQLSAEDELELQSLLKQLLISISDRISGAPSTECAEEILLHLEETDKNFHNYEFVKYLRQYVDSSLGAVVEEETKNLTRGGGQHAIGSGHDTLIHAITRKTRDSTEYLQMIQTLKNSMIMVVESLVNRFEEDRLKKEEEEEEEMQGAREKQSSSQFMDNCSDSDSSFNQSYAFLRQEQLQVLAEKLDSSKPKEVRWQALQALCCAPPSDVLSCESWSGLRRKLCAALTESDPDLSDNVLQFFAKSFSSSPMNVTREIYTSLAKTVESSFSTHRLSFPSGSTVMDINRPEVSRLLKQIRLMNDFQKEVTTFWIRHPEKYMEEVIDSTFSLLCFHHEHGSSSSASEKVLEPIHLLALLDIKATWFNKWMHGYYSRTVVLRLLEWKYKSLVVAAVQRCIHYGESCERLSDQPTNLQSAEQQQQNSAQRSVYSGQELEYAAFVHSLCFLGKLLIYTNGRKLFPVRVRKHKVSLSPSSLVMELLWMLCETTEGSAQCLYQPAVIETLLTPVVAVLSGQQCKLKSPAATLTLIADILARVANTDRGLALFLYERNVFSTPHGERTTAALVIVHFTLKLLNRELPTLSDSDSYSTLCGAFIFVCRQMYNTCEGLQVLRPHGLHEAVAAAWKKTSSLSERIPTPVPGASVGGSTQKHQDMLVWEETLLDSLLNFAATPKGLLLLQQTGAINECISYMFSRFTKKLQVSRCEKFGYGVMVTQVAATAPGVVALQRSGFVRALVVELWSTLECGTDDVRVVRPKPTPMDPVDRSCHKSLLSLVNLLSSSHSVWELLCQQPLANKSDYTLREIPTSIPDLMDRLISVNSDVKIHSLFHYEQSHTFGLRLLSVLCCNLDSFLLLESQYNICSLLLHSQRQNVTEPGTNHGSIIIDGLSVERNHVLVRVCTVGGPSERRLPPRALQQGEDPYPWPMFCSLPLPHCYTLEPPRLRQPSAESEMSSFLLKSKDVKTDDSWMVTCRRLFCRVMTSKPDVLTGKVLADLLDVVVLHLSSSECFFSPAQYKVEDNSVKTTVLTPVEELGIDTCLRYGRFLKILTDDSAQDLNLLMKHLKVFLSTHRVKSSPPQLLTQRDSYPGHDWLAATVFLLMSSDLDKSLRFLLGLSSLLASAFLWPAGVHASCRVPAAADSGISPMYWCTAHYVEMLLKTEVPLVHSAFRMSGFTPSQVQTAHTQAARIFLSFLFFFFFFLIRNI